MEKTKIRRLPPCGSCNIEAMEHWLTDMAQEGWRLLDSRAGRLAFVKERPQCPQYCLVPVEKRNDDRPDGVMMANAETHGWNYVAKWNEWFIFRSTVPCPSALYPSPEARAEGLDVIKKRLIQGLIIEGILLVFYFGVIWYAGFANFLLEAMTTPSPGLTAGFLLLLLSSLITPVCGVKRINSLQKKLRSGQGPDRQRDWRKNAPVIRLMKAAEFGLCVLVLLAALGTTLFRDAGKIPLAEFPGEPPFVTLEDLSPADQELTIDHIDNGYFRKGRGPLFPLVIQWLDGGSVSYHDGDPTGGLLDIRYAETAGPALALWTAKNLTASYGRGSGENTRLLTEFDIDYAAGVNRKGQIRVILANRNRVVCARFSMGDINGNFTLENWTRQMAEELKK